MKFSNHRILEFIKQKLDVARRRFLKRVGVEKITTWNIVAFLWNKLWRFLKELGGISLFFTVVIFLITQHNTYVAIGNSINADTGANFSLENAILSDQNKEWGYLQTFSLQNYNSNWNYIVQYYGSDCFQAVRNAVGYMEGMNTLIIQRQTGNMILNPNSLFEMADKLKPLLVSFMNCKLKSQWSAIFYKLIY